MEKSPSGMSPAQSSSTSITFCKLNGKNFNTWAFSIECFLTDQDLWEVVAEPVNSADPVAVRKDAKARAKICLACDEAIYPVIRSAKTAFETYNCLKKAFADSGLSRKLGLMKKLLANELRGNVHDYVNTALALQQELQGIGAAVDDEFLAIILLTGLPDRYQPLVMALEHSNTKINSENVVAALLKEDSRAVHSTKTVPKPQESAAALNTKNGQKKKKFCIYCKKLGHLVNECKIKNKKVSATCTSNYISQFTLSSCFTSSSTGSQDWYIDSGASSHMSNRRDWFDSISSHITSITVANNEQLLSQGKGTVSLNISEYVQQISDVLYIPGLATNLLSVKQLVNKGFDVLFTSQGAQIFQSGGCQVTNSVIATGSNHRGMYKLDVQKSPHALYTPTKESAILWHRRLGHPNTRSMTILKNKNIGIDFNGTYTEKCIPCLQGKLSRKSFPNSKSRSSKVLQLIHSDLCGPMSTHSWGGALYLLTFTDDFSRKTFGYLLKSKSEVFSKFVEYKHLVENQTGERIKVLRTDNGGEYVNHILSTFLKENGIVHQTTIPYTPQQNGVSERANRTIIEKARSMLKDSKLPLSYWGEAVNTAIYLKNRMPTQSLNNMIPEELWTKKKVNLSHLRVFGCEAHVLIPKEKRAKLDSKTQTCIFVGYATESKGYRLIDPQNPRVIIVARDVVFIEDKMCDPVHHSYSDMQSPSQLSQILVPLCDNQHVSVPQPNTPVIPQPQPDTSVAPETLTDPSGTTSVSTSSPEYLSASDDPISHEVLPVVQETEPIVNPLSDRRYPSRSRNPPERYGYLTSDLEPETYKEVTAHPQKQKWLDAMKAEYDSLLKHGTWVLVDRPIGRKTTKCKWVFKLKKDTSGQITKYKARLVAKGFTQVAGIDYGETFSPVARLSSVRILLAFAAHHGLQVDHLDVETAFLNGDLEEEIYMEQPDGFSNDPKTKVYLLKKALYGLKQAPRQWNLKVCDAMVKFGLKQATSEHCLYYKQENNDLLVVAVFVDDFFIVCTNDAIKNKFKDELKKEFTVKDLGPLRDCLGIRIHQKDGAGIKLDQTKFIEKLLTKFNMTDAISVATPLEPGLKLTIPKKEEEELDLPYQELIGSLMYIAICTRPDIAHTVSYLSQFNAHYGGVHWRAAKRVLRYLKGTKDLCLHYRPTAHFRPECYVDADYGNNLVDRRSFTGFVYMMGGAPISWEARKQRTVALSTTEAEYMALSEACKEAIYLKSLISQVFAVESSPIVIHTDNQSSLKLAHNNTYHARTKHIDIKHHFIRDSLSQHNLKLIYIPTQHMIADVLTKPLPKLKHNKCVLSLGLV